jgi:hypothetical protein
MILKTLTVKNVSEDVIELLRSIRHYERRQLAVIIEECVAAYYQSNYED